MSRAPSPWSFGGPPKAVELLVGALAVAMAVSGLSVVDAIAWGWVAVGALVVVVALGPLKSYTVAADIGDRLGRFQDDVGLLGRTVVVLVLAGVLVGTLLLSGVDGPSLFYLGQGGLLAVAGVVAIKWVRHREIAG